MARNRGKHRKSSPAGRKIARLVVAGAVVGTPIAMAVAPAQAASDNVWDKVAQCESTGNWSINSGNGFYGGLQFTQSTWQAYGGGAFASSPNQASREQQIQVAERVLAGQGAGAWPVCSQKAGLTNGGAVAVSTPVVDKPAAHPAPAAKPKAAPAATPQAAPAPTAPANGTYTVAPGDTLSVIADKLGVSGGWNTLYQNNQGVVGNNPDLILPGQVLNI